jgi:ribulose bisphosphate carboxylase small subunit
MVTIAWLKKKDLFILDRNTLADISDWAMNIVNYHKEDYDTEDIKQLNILLDKIYKCLCEYMKDGKIRTKLRS